MSPTLLLSILSLEVCGTLCLVPLEPALCAQLEPRAGGCYAVLEPGPEHRAGWPPHLWVSGQLVRQVDGLPVAPGWGAQVSPWHDLAVIVCVVQPCGNDFCLADPECPRARDPALVFIDGFESGDLSAWD